MDINAYLRQLSPAEIAAGAHRDFVGGLWEELGTLQFDFLRGHGLQPQHRLLDLGCGALRGGLHFMRYLEAGHYYGIDINASLIEAGRRELEREVLERKTPQLLVNDKFEVGRFATMFDCAIAVSVFTHLPINHIVRCLVEVGRVLKPEAHFFASYFEAPFNACLDSLTHVPGNVVTNYDADPYHYSFEEVRWMAEVARLKVERIGEWGHPRSQKMLSFRKEA